jgi:hypothetical protein
MFTSILGRTIEISLMLVVYISSMKKAADFIWKSRNLHTHVFKIVMDKYSDPRNVIQASFLQLQETELLGVLLRWF